MSRCEFAVHAVPLDLNVHEIDEVPGKAISVNGATYLLGEMIAEGGQAFIFPATNVVSRISWFVAKICKWRPGTDEYDREAQQGQAGFRIAVDGVPVVHTENYEIPGALIRLEQLMGDLHEDAAHDELMKEGTRLLKNDQAEEALLVFDKVLALNPNHSYAMINKAGVLIRLGRAHETIPLLLRSRDIEPNERLVHQQLAHALVNLGHAREAISVLDERLTVCRWDYDTWELKSRIAERANLTDVLEEMERDLTEFMRGE